MKKLISIKPYQCNFEIVYKENEETSVYSLVFDGMQGEYTMEEWKEDDFISQFSEDDQEEIIDYLNIYQILKEEEEEEEEQTNE